MVCEHHFYRMMKITLGFRVSGCFGTKHPIIIDFAGDLAKDLSNSGPSRATITNSTLQRAGNMRGDYYVVPPNGARIHTFH